MKNDGCVQRAANEAQKEVENLEKAGEKSSEDALKEEYLQFFRKLDWRHANDSFLEPDWEASPTLQSIDQRYSYNWPENRIAVYRNYIIDDPEYIVEQLLSAMHYSIEQMEKKNYRDVLEINSYIINTSLWIDGDAGEYFDDAVPLPYFAFLFPNLQIPAARFQKLAFLAVYNGSDPENRVQNLYRFLADCFDYNWNYLSLSDLLKEHESNLKDWKSVFSQIYALMKDKTKESSWEAGTFYYWQNSFIRVLEGEEAYLRSF